MKKLAIFLVAAAMAASFSVYAAPSGDVAVASPPFVGHGPAIPPTPQLTEAQISAGILSGKYVCVSITNGKQLKAMPMPKEKWQPVLEPYHIMPAKSNMVIKSVDDFSNDVAVITEKQLKAITEGMTYYDIATKLGKTRDTMMNKAYEYRLKDGRILFLTVKSKTAKCALSGDELLASAVMPRNNLNSQSKGDYFGIITNQPAPNSSGGASLAVYSTGKGSLGAAYVTTTKNTGYFFENGKPAKPTDLKFGTPVLITIQGAIAESYPVQVRAKKVVILDRK